MNSNRFSCENRTSAAAEPPMRPIDADAAAATSPMRLIRLFLHHPYDLFDASHVWPPARLIETATGMPPALSIACSSATLKNWDNEWSAKKR